MADPGFSFFEFFREREREKISVFKACKKRRLKEIEDAPLARLRRVN
jgi:hypothetical protein